MDLTLRGLLQALKVTPVLNALCKVLTFDLALAGKEREGVGGGGGGGVAVEVVLTSPLGSSRTV